MKILFVAVFTPNSTNVSQSRGFKSLGHEVYEYDYRAIRSRLNNSIQKRDEHLIAEIGNFKPDLTVFSKCSEMGYQPVLEANKYGRTVLWYMDSVHNMNKELEQKCIASHYVFSSHQGIVDIIVKLNPNTFFLDACPDEKMNFKIDNTIKKYDKVFIGETASTMHTERNFYIKECDITHFNNVYGLQHNQIVNETKINVGFSPTDKTGSSVRVYKIIASGGFLMTTPWPALKDSFEDGKHLVTFNSVEEFNEKSKYYLDNEQERECIASAGHLHVLNNFMPDKWASKIVNIIK